MAAAQCNWISLFNIASVIHCSRSALLLQMICASLGLDGNKELQQRLAIKNALCCSKPTEDR
eukprot:scaffold607_cov160-Ochromonas_danica.AAC.10